MPERWVKQLLAAKSSFRCTFTSVNEYPWKDAVSGCNRLPWRSLCLRRLGTGWNFSTVGRLEFCGLWSELLYLRGALAFWNSHAWSHSGSEQTPYDNKVFPRHSNSFHQAKSQAPWAYNSPIAVATSWLHHPQCVLSCFTYSSLCSVKPQKPCGTAFTVELGVP